MHTKKNFTKLELSLIKSSGRLCPQCKNWVDKQYINRINKKCNSCNNDFDSLPPHYRFSNLTN